MGVMESVTNSVADAIKKGIGRKNLVAIVAMCLLASVPELPLIVCGMIAGVATVAILTQWRLDTAELWIKGEDLPDNGQNGENGDGMGTQDTDVPVVS